MPPQDDFIFYIPPMPPAEPEGEWDAPLPPLEEGDFYMLPTGAMVFTAQYHLKRGYCCGSGCRHCPY